MKQNPETAALRIFFFQISVRIYTSLRLNPVIFHQNAWSAKSRKLPLCGGTFFFFQNFRPRLYLFTFKTGENSAIAMLANISRIQENCHFMDFYLASNFCPSLYLTTVKPSDITAKWLISSVHQLPLYGFVFFKIPSACILFFDKTLWYFCEIVFKQNPGKLLLYGFFFKFSVRAHTYLRLNPVVFHQNVWSAESRKLPFYGFFFSKFPSAFILTPVKPGENFANL